MRVKFLILPLIVCLASCSITINYEETDLLTFSAKAEQASEEYLNLNKDEQYYTSCAIKGSITFIFSGEEMRKNIYVRFTYSSKTNGWTNNARDELEEDYAENYFFTNISQILSTIETIEVTENNIKYYTAESAFKIDGSYKGKKTDLEIEVSSLRYVFNKYSLLTEINEVSITTMVSEDASLVIERSVDLKISYLHR